MNRQNNQETYKKVQGIIESYNESMVDNAAYEICKLLGLEPPAESVLPVDPSKWSDVEINRVDYDYKIYVPTRADVDFIMAMPGVAEAGVDLVKDLEMFYDKPVEWVYEHRRSRLEEFKCTLRKAGVTL